MGSIKSEAAAATDVWAARGEVPTTSKKPQHSHVKLDVECSYIVFLTEIPIGLAYCTENEVDVLTTFEF